MRLSITLLSLTLLPLPLLAQEPMSGAEFESYTTGRTLTFESDGTPYGIEQYLPDRRVIWSYIGQECRRGSWYEDGDHICFTYEHDPTPQCWIFTETPRGLRAEFQNGGPATELVEAGQGPEELRCPGPDVGV